MPPSPRAAPPDPRRVALTLIRQVTDERRSLAEALDGPAILSLPAEIRATAQRLALMALRGAGRADALALPLIARRPPPAVLAILRLGLSELASGAAPHGVVHAMVELAGRDPATRGARGLVNAVLRRLAPDLDARWGSLPAAPLPDWIGGPVRAAWGDETARLIAEAHLIAPPLDLTARDDPAGLAARIGAVVPAVVLPTGSVRLAVGLQISALPGYAEGAFWVQDAAAALPAQLLAVQRDEKVLDLCAAPGGKTMQLAARGARVTAVDSSARRLDRLSANLRRTGLTARVVTADVLDFHETGFGAILLDAPCSATGTIRRHPDLPFHRDGSGLAELIALQARLIDHAVGLLAPGGRLVFATCSLLTAEGEDQIRAARSRHPGLGVIPAALPGLSRGQLTDEGGLRLLPHQGPAGGWDGFYMACLTRPA